MNILKNFISDKTKVLKISLVLGGLAIVAMASFLATTAYISTQTNQKNNIFTPYTLTDTNIIEPNGTYYNIKDYCITDKVVRVQNSAGENKKPVFVRVIATVESAEPEQFTTVKVLSENLNESWYYNSSDGYYYYKYILYPGYQTQELFKDGKIYLSENENVKITFTTDTVQAWANGKRNIITTEFVQNAWGSTPNYIDNKNASIPV